MVERLKHFDERTGVFALRCDLASLKRLVLLGQAFGEKCRSDREEAADEQASDAKQTAKVSNVEQDLQCSQREVVVIQDGSRNGPSEKLVRRGDTGKKKLRPYVSLNISPLLDDLSGFSFESFIFSLRIIFPITNASSADTTVACSTPEVTQYSHESATAPDSMPKSITPTHFQSSELEPGASLFSMPLSKLNSAYRLPNSAMALSNTNDH